MVRKYLLPLLAIVGVAAAVHAVQEASTPVTSQPAVMTPAPNPFHAGVAGAGIVEAESQNIAVAPAIGGIVKEVYVKWGQQVAAGDKLFQIDPQPMQAQIAAQEGEVASRRAAVAQAQANLSRLQAAPRAEDVPVLQARLAQAQAAMDNAKSQWDNAQKLAGSHVMGEEEFNQRHFAFEQSAGVRDEAKANLDRLLAGSWKEDITVAKADLQAAQSQLEAAQARLEPLKVDLARLTVNAPVAGTVLRINARQGEFQASAGVAAASDAAIVIGNIDSLHVRVDIDENDVVRFDKAAKATGTLRGRPEQPIDLDFVRVEPFVIPKRNLTGNNTERVDTRVLQVIYAIHKTDIPVYVGQQIDVFVNSK